MVGTSSNCAPPARWSPPARAPSRADMRSDGGTESTKNHVDVAREERRSSPPPRRDNGTWTDVDPGIVP